MSEDLIEAIEFAFGKQIKIRDDAAVIITVGGEGDAGTLKKFRRSYTGLPRDVHKYYELKNDVSTVSNGTTSGIRTCRN